MLQNYVKTSKIPLNDLLINQPFLRILEAGESFWSSIPNIQSIFTSPPYPLFLGVTHAADGVFTYDDAGY